MQRHQFNTRKQKNILGWSITLCVIKIVDIVIVSNVPGRKEQRKKLIIDPITGVRA